MGAHGSKNHRNPINYPPHYQSVHNNPRFCKNNNSYAQQRRLDLAFDSGQPFPDAIENDRHRFEQQRPPHFAPHHQQHQPNNNINRLSRLRQRPQLSYAHSDVTSSCGNNNANGGNNISENPFPTTTRTLRPILAPQSTQFDTTLLQQRNGRYSSSTHFRPSSVDRTSLMGTLPKQVQFSTIKRGEHQPPTTRVTFGSTSAIATGPRHDECGGSETNAVFTKSKDSHHASQLAINVTYNRPEGSSNKTNTIDRRTLMSNRMPTRASTLRRQHALGVSSITRYRSDPALLENANSNSLPRVGGPVVIQQDDRFNVEDLQNSIVDTEPPQLSNYPTASLQRRTVATGELVNVDGVDGVDGGLRPKLRVLRPPPQQRRIGGPLNTGSVTELSDIVAANSADSGVEMKPELFSLLSDNSPNGNNTVPLIAAQPSPPPPPPTLVQRHHSLPRHLITAPKTKPVNSNNSNNPEKNQQFYVPPCHCEDCRHPINVGRSQPNNRFSTNFIGPTSNAARAPPARPVAMTTAANIKPLPPRPLPPDPPESDQDESTCYYNDDCPYEGCCCEASSMMMNSSSNSNSINNRDESDYQRLIHRSYKGQPPALRRGTVLPPKTIIRRRMESPSDDIYVAAFSGESTLLRRQYQQQQQQLPKPKSTKNCRAPDPPPLQRRRAGSMYIISPASEKENNTSTSVNTNDATTATFLAKEKNGALVIVNRVDLEMGLLSGKYVQYDIAPPLLLDQAAKQVELQSDQSSPLGDVETTIQNNSQQPPPPDVASSLLMTCGVDSGDSGIINGNNVAMETLSSSHYDSGVSPADSSSASNGTPASSTNTGGVDSNSSTGTGSPPPMLPPRQRPPQNSNSNNNNTRRTSTGLYISAAARNKLEEMLMMRNNILMHIEASGVNDNVINNQLMTKNTLMTSSHNEIDATLRELSCVSPPQSLEIQQQQMLEQL